MSSAITGPRHTNQPKDFILEVIEPVLQLRRKHRYAAIGTTWHREHPQSRGRLASRKFNPKSCVICHEEFTPTSPGAKFCSNPCALVQGQVNDRKRHLTATYGLTVDDYGNLLTLQDHRCAICKAEGTASKGHFAKLHVDHCHSSGKVRGLLCNGCNTGLGKFQENPEALRNAALYVETHAAAATH